MESALKDHCQSIRNHAKDLASKNYHTLEGINTVEFVLMYVPLESAFSAAMKLHLTSTWNLQPVIMSES